MVHFCSHCAARKPLDTPVGGKVDQSAALSQRTDESSFPSLSCETMLLRTHSKKKYLGVGAVYCHAADGPGSP